MSNLLVNIATVLGGLSFFLGLLIFIWQRSNETIDSYLRGKHLIIALSSQLDVIGSWAGENKGGYSKANLENLIQDNLDRWGNPFSLIFDLSPGTINELGLTTEMLTLKEDLMKVLPALNQEITSFNAALHDIRLFKFSRDAEQNIRLHLKLNKKVGDELTMEESEFVRKLAELYALLHIEHIGDDRSQRLYSWHKKTRHHLIEAEKQFRNSSRKWYRWIIPFWRKEYCRDCPFI